MTEADDVHVHKLPFEPVHQMALSLIEFIQEHHSDTVTASVIAAVALTMVRLMAPTTMTAGPELNYTVAVLEYTSKLIHGAPDHATTSLH